MLHLTIRDTKCNRPSTISTPCADVMTNMSTQPGLSNANMHSSLRNNEGMTLDPQLRDQAPSTSSAGQSSTSPILRKRDADAVSGTTSIESRQRKAVKENGEMKKSSRRRMACQSCRNRKVKCDNARPSCAICASNGAECIYIESPAAPVLDPTSSLLLERLDQILAGVNGIASGIPSGSSPGTVQSPPTHNASASFGNLEVFNESSRDYLQIPACVTTADAALTWPVFEGQFRTDALVGIIFNPEESLVNSSAACGPRSYHPDSVSDDTYQVPGGLQSLPDERIPSLIDRFLECVHTKNPILDVDALLKYGRKAAENGLSWDAPSCLVLIACALGSIAHPFDFAASNTMDGRASPGLASSSLFGRELAQAESCYVLACRRLGLLKQTVLGAQCHFYTGVFLMYTFRPLAAWNHFCQASTFYQIYSKTISGPERGTFNELRGMSATQRRLEQSLYWSCFKSECEIRVELPLPQSSIADFEYPHLFPSPPSPPEPPQYGDDPTSPDHIFRDPTIRWTEELSWYYYLTEVALRRIGNRITNTFYRNDHNAWLDIVPLIPIAEEFEAQISTWSANLPIVMQYDSGRSDGGVATSKELGWATSNRLLEMKAWLYQPFLFYAIHTRALRMDGPENQTLRRLVDAAMECNHSIVQNRSVRHRHHGIWFDIRALVTAAVILSAVIKCGNVAIPVDWEESFTSIIETVKFWEDESPDLKKTRSVLERLLEEARRTVRSRMGT